MIAAQQQSVSVSPTLTTATTSSSSPSSSPAIAISRAEDDDDGGSVSCAVAATKRTTYQGADVRHHPGVRGSSRHPRSGVTIMAAETSTTSSTSATDSRGSAGPTGNKKNSVVINSKQVCISATSPKSSVTSSVNKHQRGCNRCQKCTSYQPGGQDWRNICTACRCPRNCHDLLIGATCCGTDRIGFDHITGSPNPQSSNSSSENSPGESITSSTQGCRRKALAEVEGYSWIPHVSVMQRL